MLINFRQGIINAQVANDYVQLNNGYVNLNVDIVPIDLAFAYGTHDYLFTESEQVLAAWGPFQAGVTSYLYWDINLRTGVRTFGMTTIAPTFGTTYPTNPALHTHFFDLIQKKMFYWSGSSWIPCLRIFAGNVENAAILNPSPLGSQVNLNSQISLGYILFDSNQIPGKFTDNAGNNYFLTTETPIHTQQDNKNAYRLDAVLMSAQSFEPIPAYHCVTWKGPKKLGVASYMNFQYPCIGISVENSGINEVKPFITKGLVTNYINWNFSEAPNTPLFVGAQGELTTTVPQRYSIQRIGHVVSSNTVYIDIQPIELINGIVVPSITPTLSPTPTPSITISSTQTPTPTPSITVTPTFTPTTTVTPTVSPT